MEFQDTTCATLATLLNFACHPVVLGPDNRKISADYVYYLRNYVENERGGTSIFFSGSLGDINPTPIHDDWIYGRDGGTFGMAEELGSDIADDMLYAAELKDTISIELHVKTKRCTMDNGPGPDPYSDIAILDLGMAQIAMIPGEPLTGFGEKIESFFPGPYTLVFGLTNDYVSYIVPEDEWETCTYSFLSSGCYEESAAFDKAVAGILEQGFSDLAGEMFSMDD